MSRHADEIGDFLMRRTPTDEIDIQTGFESSPQPNDEIGDFLMRRTPADSGPAVNDTLIPDLNDAPSPDIQDAPKPSESELGNLTQVSQGMMGKFIDLLGLPGEAANWAMGKAGLGKPFHTGESLRNIGAKAGIAFPAGQEPDTGAIKVGQTMAMGLEFLAPFLAAFKTASLAKIAPGATKPIAVNTTKTGVAKDVAATLAAPFVRYPKLASYSEVVGATGAGLGGYYGGKQYGKTGEILGGLAGGIAPQVTPMIVGAAVRKGIKALNPATKSGGKLRAAAELQKNTETRPDTIPGTIANERKNTLSGADLSPASLSGDKHLMAVEAKLLKANPELAHKFEMKRDSINELVRAEIKQLGGNVPIEKTQAYMRWRADHVNTLIDKKTDMALLSAKDSLERLSPRTGRIEASRIVDKQIDSALASSKAIETEAWNKVNKQALGPTSAARDAFRAELLDRAPTAAKEEIPKFVAEFLGEFDKSGAWKMGTLGVEETVNSLVTFRRRLTDAMRKEAASEGPNWNRHRIMNNIQAAILRDLETIEPDTNLISAIAVSRKHNEKFKGGVMDIILGSELSGRKLAPEMTLEPLQGGTNAGVMARDIIKASPESRPMIEDFVKSKMATSLVDPGTGRLKYKKALKYVEENELMLETFPELKQSLNHAIGQEERAARTLLKGKAAKKLVAGSSVAKLSGVKPGRVLPEIMSSTNPRIQMRNTFRKSNAEGKKGLKNDIASYLLNKSKTSLFNDNNQPVHSGRAMAFEWAENKDIFKEALTPAEVKRIDIIVNTAIKNEKVSLPTIDNIPLPDKNWLRFLVRISGATTGSKIAKVMGPGNIQIPGMISKKGAETFDKFDTGRARQILADSIQDGPLFNELLESATSPARVKHINKVLQGWLIADSVKALDDDQ